MFDLLHGLRVVDLTAVVLGPYATQLLGGLGADVIKVEPPGGDIYRRVRPGRSETMGAGYLNLNRNKRSVTLDLKSDEGRAALADLLEEADVLVHNMRLPAAARLGLAYDDLSKRYPRLVYCAAPGFGSDGPYGDWPAYDDVIQAVSGLAALNTNDKGEPRFLSTIVGDKVSGLHLALAVLAGAIHQRMTGKGCFIEAPMFESLVSFLMVEQLAGQSFQPPLGGIGYERLLSPYRRPYKTEDGFICVVPYSAGQWTRFLNHIGRQDLAEAEWVQDMVQRSERVGELYEIVAGVMPERTSAAWLKVLRELDVPCAPVQGLADLQGDAHLREVGFFADEQHPTEGDLTAMRSPFRVTGAQERVDSPAPNLGEHNGRIAWRQRGGDGA